MIIHVCHGLKRWGVIFWRTYCMNDLRYFLRRKQASDRVITRFSYEYARRDRTVVIVVSSVEFNNKPRSYSGTGPEPNLSTHHSAFTRFVVRVEGHQRQLYEEARVLQISEASRWSRRLQGTIEQWRLASSSLWFLLYSSAKARVHANFLQFFFIVAVLILPDHLLLNTAPNIGPLISC
jgi:hypothetical protein